MKKSEPTTTENTPEGAERRDYFRVVDNVIFDFNPIDSHTAENSEPSEVIDEGRATELISELRKLEESMQISLKNITEKHREIGTFLHKLNQKVDIIAKSTLFGQKHTDKEASEVNLSEGGIAFQSNRALYKGNYLAIRLIFLPSFIPLVVFGKVIRCESGNASLGSDDTSQADEYQIAASFYKLKETDRKELARQLMRAQVRSRNQSG